MPDLPAVHPLQPRFAQAITGVLCLEAVLFDTPAAVVVALALVLLNLLAPRWSPVAWTFRRIARPSGDLEPAAPVRFSQGLAAGFLILALVLLGVGAGLAGWILVGLVAAIALFSAISGFCVGCEVYRLLLARRGGAAADVRDDLGLTGAGPVAGRTDRARLRALRAGRPRAGGASPATARCMRVSLREHPRAAVAAGAQRARGAGRVGADGSLRAARAGRLERSELMPRCWQPSEPAWPEAPIAPGRRGSILVGHPDLRLAGRARDHLAPQTRTFSTMTTDHHELTTTEVYELPTADVEELPTADVEEPAPGTETVAVDLDSPVRALDGPEYIEVDGEQVPNYDLTIPIFSEGDVVTGRVVRVDKDEVLVDIGYKSEGVIPLPELSIRKSVKPEDEVSLGEMVDALVMQKEDPDGRLILSKKRARFEKAWKRIEAAAAAGENVEGTVIEVVKGGLILDLGVRGFLPASLVDPGFARKLLAGMAHRLREADARSVN